MAKTNVQACFPAWRRLYRKMIADPGIFCEGLLYGLKAFSVKQKVSKAKLASKLQNTTIPFEMPNFRVRYTRLLSELEFSKLDKDLIELPGIPSRKYIGYRKEFAGLKDLPVALLNNYELFLDHARFSSCFVRQICVGEKTIHQEHRFLAQKGHHDFDMVLCPSGRFVYGLDLSYILSVLKEKDPKFPELATSHLEESVRLVSGGRERWYNPVPAAIVELTEPFLIMSKPVTVGMFMDLLGLNSEFLRELRRFLPHIEREKTKDSARYGTTKAVLDGVELSLSENKPVQNGVEFVLACVFCNRLSQLQSLPEYYEFFDSASGKRYSNLELLVKKRELGTKLIMYDQVEADTREIERAFFKFYNSVQIKRNKGSKGYRLPTAIEWEYAAKAGEDTLYAGTNRMGDAGYYKVGTTAVRRPDVGLKKPNPWGIYDVYGNVYEYCDSVYMPRRLLLEAFEPIDEVGEYTDSSGNTFKIINENKEPKTMKVYRDIDESEETLELVRKKKIEETRACEKEPREKLKALKERKFVEGYSSSLNSQIYEQEGILRELEDAIKDFEKYEKKWVIKGTFYNHTKDPSYRGVPSYTSCESAFNTGFRVARSL